MSDLERACEQWVLLAPGQSELTEPCGEPAVTFVDGKWLCAGCAQNVPAVENVPDGHWYVTSCIRGEPSTPRVVNDRFHWPTDQLAVRALDAYCDAGGHAPDDFVTMHRDVSRHGGDEPRRGQTLGPRETQEGAATPGQGASLAAGNVAEPHLGPGRAARAGGPPCRPIFHRANTAYFAYLDVTKVFAPRAARVALRTEMLEWLAGLGEESLAGVISDATLTDEIRQFAREERNRR